MKFYEEDDDQPLRRRRRSEPGFWHTLNCALLILVIVGFFLGVGIIFYPVWHQQHDMRARLASLERELTERQQHLSSSQEKISLLKTDPEYLETIARDRLDLMKPGETVFRIELPPTLGTGVQP